MDRKAGWATVHVVTKESDITEQLTLFLLGIGRKKKLTEINVLEWIY